MRRRGVARQLCLSVLDWAQDLGVGGVEMSSWEFNDSAHQALRDLGFSDVARRMSVSVGDGC